MFFTLSFGRIMLNSKKKLKRPSSLSNTYSIIAFNTVIKRISDGYNSKITLHIGTLVNVNFIIDENFAAIKVVNTENLYEVSEEDLWKCPRNALIHVDKGIWPYLTAVSSPVQRVCLLKQQYLCEKLTALDVGSLVDVLNYDNDSTLTPAVIKYKGSVSKKGPGIYFGVELLEGEGECDGRFGSQRYFSSPQGTGLFVPIDRLRLPLMQMIPTVTGKLSTLHIRQNGEIESSSLIKVGDRVVWLSYDGPKVGIVRWMSGVDSPEARISVQFDEPVKTDYDGCPEYTRTAVLPACKLIKASEFYFGGVKFDDKIHRDALEKVKDKSEKDPVRIKPSGDLITFDTPPPSVEDGLSSEDEGLPWDLEFSVGSLVEIEIRGLSHYGVIRWLGRLSPRSQITAGIEMEEEIPGLGDGVYNGKQYFMCNPGRALFTNVANCRRDSRFHDSSASLYTNTQPQVDIGCLDSPVIPGAVAPISREDNITDLCGKYRGIQGHHNSCYLDATLFSMFTFTSVFDSLLFRPPGACDIPEYDEVQRVLREEIVNPLRTNLYVRSDRVMKLRTLMDRLSSVSGLTTEEKDPEEFLTSLVAQILRAEPFLKLSSGQEAYLYQLFLEKDESITFPTVQQLFDQSFLSSDIKLSQVPSCLIIQMPRFGKSYKMYPRILPSQVLDVTDVILDSPRQCTVCGKLAEYECKQCFNQCDAGLQSISFCSSCLETAHSHDKRRNHCYRELSVSPEFLELRDHCSIPRLYMSLFAVVCIETSHYVSFVKCGTGSEAPWCFFDSMADRKGEQDGYNIPEVVACPDLGYWLSERGFQALQQITDEKQLPEHAKRLLCDAYMCIYQSTEIMMYR